MTKSLDLSKPVQTRDGRKARIIATDLAGNQPLAVAVTDPSGNEWLSCFSLDGAYYVHKTSLAPEDLVNAPDVKIVWFNWYPAYQRFDFNDPWTTSLEVAKNNRKSGGVTLQVTIEDGIPVAICKVE